MKGSSLDVVRVGDVFIALPFVVLPADIAEHRERCLLRAAHHEPAETFCAVRQVGALAGRAQRVCPTAILVDRAVDAIAGVVRREGGPRVAVRGYGCIRHFASAAVGEPVVATATVRYRSRRTRETCHVTLEVGIRRRSGRLLARFELGLELSLADDETEEPPDHAPLGQDAA
jgi:hypothetical protein